ncbi:MAG TPA: ubiquitin-like small modifier protein 1 [Actinomycetota bacterium]|jgi:MoaD family protein
MAARVKLPTILRTHTDGRAAVEADGGTVGEVLLDLEARHPGVTRTILTDDGAGLHRFVNVYVNGEDVRYGGGLGAHVADGDTISILPAVAGG